MPSILRQSDGCLTIVYEGFGGSSWGSFDVNAIRSCDDGHTWVKQPVFMRGTPPPRAHAPTIAMLSDGRGVVSSYDEEGDARVQFSAAALNGTNEVLWSTPRVAVRGPAEFPEVFTDALHGRVWLAYGRGGATLVESLKTFVPVRNGPHV